MSYYNMLKRNIFPSIFLETIIYHIEHCIIVTSNNNDKNEQIDNTQASSAGGEASADYIIRGAGEEVGNDTEEDRTTTNETGISDKLKGKVKGVKDKVVGTTQKAVDTTKKTVSSSTSQQTEETTRVDRTKDPTQEYDEKEPMSPAKIKQHEPTAVSRDSSDQKIAEGGQTSSQDAAEKARRSGMTKGTAGAAETGSEYEQGAAGSNK
jgi:hypothetical protein